MTLKQMGCRWQKRKIKKQNKTNHIINIKISKNRSQKQVFGLREQVDQDD